MPKTMLKILMVFAHLTTSGCALLIGKAIYDSGESKRLYNAPYEETIQACTLALKSLNFTSIENFSGGIQTETRAQWHDGTPVKIFIQMKALRITEVSIRFGAVGVRDKTISEMIHFRIAQKLTE